MLVSGQRSKAEARQRVGRVRHGPRVGDLCHSLQYTVRMFVSVIARIADVQGQVSSVCPLILIGGTQRESRPRVAWVGGLLPS